MAVYKRGYEPYEGRLTPEWLRFLVIARQAYRRVFASKWTIFFFLLAAVDPIVSAIIIYLPHNAGATQLFDIRRFVTIDATFFHRFVNAQASLVYLLTAFLGPGLVSPDLANNALPLYFCRPFSRTEYVVGKASVLAILLSAITWIPGLLLFGFQSYLEGWKWFWDNLYIAGAIFVGSWLWILLLSLLALAISAWVKWKLAAGALLVAILFVAAGVGEAFEKVLDSQAAGVLNLLKDIDVVWFSLFRMENSAGISFTSAVGALLVTCALCLYLLSRKIRAFEVERS